MMIRLVSAWLLAGLVATASAGEVRYTGEGHAYNPVWSLDGTHLAFEVNNYGDRSDLHISLVLGEIAKDASKVSLPGGGGPFGGSQVVVNPAWHPQGIVVFEGSNTGGQFRLYYYQPGGGAASEMIPTQDVPGDITFPTINPKGTQMTFVADQTGNGDIYIRDTNTGKVTIALSTDVAEMFPQFDSTGSKILFTRKQNNTEDIFELTVSTGVESSVIGGNNDQTRPNYVNGGVVYFDNSRDSQEWDVKMVSGGNSRTLAKSVRLPLRARPAVSPDGDWVAYGFEDPTKSNSIMLSRVDGSKNVEIKTPHNACGEPAITVQKGKTLLAYSALPNSGADYRKLFVMDITDKL